MWIMHKLHERTLGLYWTCISCVARSFEKILFGSRVKMSFQGVHILNPSWKLRVIEKTVFQMTYHRKVSRKNNTRSITYMIARVKAAWFLQIEVPKSLS